MVPSRIETITRIRSLKWVSIRPQSMTLRPASPNNASMCSYRAVRDGGKSSRSFQLRIRGIRSIPRRCAIAKTGPLIPSRLCWKAARKPGKY